MNSTNTFYFTLQILHINYSLRFDEMGRWMDHVDNTLRTILKEVNTLEEFETEKTVFQVSESPILQSVKVI